MVNTKIRLIIFFAAEDGEALYSQQKTSLGTDCGSDHELHIAKFRLKLKKVGKTTRPFRFDLNQIPYNYSVEATNRSKGLDLIDRVLKNYGWRFITISRGSDKNHPQEKEMQGKTAVWGGLTNSWEKKRSKSKGEKERYNHLNAEFQRIARKDKKAL